MFFGLTRAADVAAVASVVAEVDEAELRSRYAEIIPSDYAPEYGDEDREYTVEYFIPLVELWQAAATAG